MADAGDSGFIDFFLFRGDAYFIFLGFWLTLEFDFIFEVTFSASALILLLTVGPFDFDVIGDRLFEGKALSRGLAFARVFYSGLGFVALLITLFVVDGCSAKSFF